MQAFPVITVPSNDGVVKSFIENVGSKQAIFRALARRSGVVSEQTRMNLEVVHRHILADHHRIFTFRELHCFQQNIPACKIKGGLCIIFK